MDIINGLILSGPKLQLASRRCLGQLLFENLKKHPMDKVFQIILDRNEQMTFAELFKLSAQVCSGMIRHGLKQGDVVALMSDNSNQLHATFLGLIWAGGVPNPIAPNLSPIELQTILQQTRPKWIFCEPHGLATAIKCVENMKSSIKIVALNSSTNPGERIIKFEDILKETDLDNFAPQPIEDPNSTVIIICSSGTTGVQKGVALSNYSILENVMKWRFLPKMDVFLPSLVTSGFSWITGIHFFFITCLYGTFRVITTSHDPRVILKTLQDYELKATMIPPAIIKYILDCPDFHKYNTTNLLEIYTGGSMMGKYVVEKFHKMWKGVRLYQLYGMTETGGLLTMINFFTDPVSIGCPIYNTDIKVVDHETREALGPNKHGEICVRGNFFFNTYIGNEEAARNLMEGDWLRTGDVGYYTENGNIYITSRIKEVLKFENTQISVVEIETFISSLPGVADAAVAGVPIGEDSHYLMAIIVKLPSSTITGDEIIQAVAENFSEQNHLRAGVHFTDELPRSVSQKLQRKKLNEMAKKLYEKSGGQLTS